MNAVDQELRMRVGVADLLATYQFLVDAGRIDEVAQLFIDDGVFETNTAR
jgi:hypothetical protein